MVVKNRTGNENPAAFCVEHGAVGCEHAHIFPYGLHGWCRGQKPCFDPSVTDTAGVCRSPQIDARTRAGRTVSREQIEVFVLGKVGQLVERDVVVGAALVFKTVVCVLHRAETDLRTRRKTPLVPGFTPLRSGKRAAVVSLGLVDELGQLGVSFSEDERAVVRDMHLPQRLNHQRFTLTAARRAAVQCLVLEAGKKDFLPLLRAPEHHVLRLLSMVFRFA